MANTNELLGAVMTGAFDDDLDLLDQAIKDRRSKTLRQRLRVGSKARVRPDAKLRPAYLRGQEFTIEKVNVKTVSGTWATPEQCGRYRCAIPVEFVEVLS